MFFLVSDFAQSNFHTPPEKTSFTHTRFCATKCVEINYSHATNFLRSDTVRKGYAEKFHELRYPDLVMAKKSLYGFLILAGRSRDIQDIYSDDESDDNRLKNVKADLSSDEEGPLGAKRKSRREDSTKKKKVARKIVESDEESE